LTTSRSRIVELGITRNVLSSVVILVYRSVMSSTNPVCPRSASSIMSPISYGWSARTNSPLMIELAIGARVIPTIAESTVTEMRRSPTCSPAMADATSTAIPSTPSRMLRRIVRVTLGRPNCRATLRPSKRTTSFETYQPATRTMTTPRIRSQGSVSRAARYSPRWTWQTAAHVSLPPPWAVPLPPSWAVTNAANSRVAASARTAHPLGANIPRPSRVAKIRIGSVEGKDRGPPGPEI